MMYSKKIFQFSANLLLIVIILFASCTKIKKLTNFYADFSANITIDPSQSDNSTNNTWIYNVPDDSKGLYQQNNSNYASTQAIEINSFKISIEDPLNSSLDIIESVEVYLRSEDMEQKRIAWFDKIPKSGLNNINLDISRDDLRDYMIDKEYVLHISITTNSSFNTVCVLKLDYEFFVSTNITDI